MRGARLAGLVLALCVVVGAPVAAGALGHAQLAMLAFAGVLWLANAVLRPDAARLRDPMALVLQAVGAAAFAALLVGLGQAARALLQLEARADLFGLVFAAAWAVVLARIVWPPGPNARAADTAEAALRRVHRAGTAPPPGSPAKPGGDAPTGRSEKTENAPAPQPASKPTPAPAPRAAPTPPRKPAAPPDPALAEGLSRLDSLPEEGGAIEPIHAALQTVSGAAPPDRVFAALEARATTQRDRRALVAHATDPWVAERTRDGEPARAFEVVVAAADAVALAEFAAGALALLDIMPSARTRMPAEARLLEISDQVEATHEGEAEALVTLAHRLEDMRIEAGEDASDA